MKICTRCGTTTTDDSQAYCLMDGTPLVDQAASEPTVVMSRTEPTLTTQQPQKKKTGLWITLAALGFVLIGGLLGLLMYAAYRMGSESASVKVNVNGKSSPTPNARNPPTSTPQTRPSTVSAPVSSQATPETSTSSPSSDEPTPISWSTNAGFVKEETGLQYSFACPPGGTPGTVWGSEIYTADSSVCTAAVHAGKITLNDGGTVTIEFAPGRQTYGATTRNGITSYNYGQYPHSIIFK
jgi:cytoskeletal protein RodZ